MKLLTSISKIGSADIISSGLAAIFWFLIASWTNPDDFGYLNYYIGIAGIASSIVMLGTQNTITVYVAKDILVHRALYIITFFLFLPIAVILFLLFNRIDILILTLSFVVGNSTIGEIFGRRDYDSYFLYTLIHRIMTIGLGILFFHQFGINSVIIAFAVAYIPYVYRFTKEFRSIKESFRFLRGRWGFIINNYAITLTAGFQGQIDKLIVLPLLGSSILGNYSLALQVITALMILPTIIFKYILPQESHGKNPVEAKKVLILLSIGLTLVGFFIIPEIIPKIYPKFNETADAIKIMSISFVPSSIVRIYTSKFLAREKSKFVLIVTSSSVLLMILVMIILCNIIGLNGVAIAFVITTVIQAALLFSMYRRVI